MKKSNIFYLCESCGNDCAKWAGQCPSCGTWNSLKEIKERSISVQVSKKGEISELQTIESSHTEKPRISSKIEEFDRVLGGGIVSDAFVLLTGDPGIGKSTLCLQASLAISENHKVLYFSGEESVSQVSARAKRLSSNIQAKNFLLSSENILENILTTLEKTECELVVIDSIQTIASQTIPAVAGSASQVKFCAEQLMFYLKQKGLACLLIGHVTKSGDFAGPQTLAHLVDAVLYLEGDKYHQFRILRGEKNRFGTTNEIGMFTMEGEGLKEVKNPSEAFLEGRLKDAEGSVIVPLIEGTRPFLVEIQALTAWTNFGYPKRTSSGIDVNRLHLMLAVLQKHGNIKLDSSDVFVNVVGGMKIQEPASDLALLMAIASSKEKKAIPNNMIILGEVGLSGEVRSVSHLEKRIKEAEKMGFTHAIIPASSKEVFTKITAISVKSIMEALKFLTNIT